RNIGRGRSFAGPRRGGGEELWASARPAGRGHPPSILRTSRTRARALATLAGSPPLRARPSSARDASSSRRVGQGRLEFALGLRAGRATPSKPGAPSLTLFTYQR